MVKFIIPSVELASLCLLIVLLNSTTPATAGPFGVLLIFIFIYILLLGVITYFLYWTSHLINHLSIVFMAKRPIRAISLKQSYYYSTIIAAAPIMLIGLQSVGMVSLYEFLLIILFVVIGCLYISKKI